MLYYNLTLRRVCCIIIYSQTTPQLAGQAVFIMNRQTVYFWDFCISCGPKWVIPSRQSFRGIQQCLQCTVSRRLGLLAYQVCLFRPTFALDHKHRRGPSLPSRSLEYNIYSCSTTSHDIECTRLVLEHKLIVDIANGVKGVVKVRLFYLFSPSQSNGTDRF